MDLEYQVSLKKLFTVSLMILIISLMQGCVVNIVTDHIFPDNDVQPAYDNYTAAMGNVMLYKPAFNNLTIAPISYESVSGGVNNTSLVDLSGMISAEVTGLNDNIMKVDSYETACDRAVAASRAYRAHIDAGSAEYDKQLSAEGVLDNQSSFAKSEKDRMVRYYNALATVSAQMETMEEYDAHQGFTIYGFAVYGRQNWYASYMRAINKSYPYDMIYTIRPTVDNYIAMDTAMIADLDLAASIAPARSDVSLFSDMKLKFFNVSEDLKKGYNLRVEFYRNYDDSGLYLEKIG